MKDSGISQFDSCMMVALKSTLQIFLDLFNSLSCCVVQQKI